MGEQERHARLARDFHRLVHQHLLGLPARALTDSVHDPDLERWWQAYLAYITTLGDARVIPEVRLSIPLVGHRVMAQYDAVVVNEQRLAEPKGSGRAAPDQSRLLFIVDWKTYRQRPSQSWLAGRLQSRVYPVVLVQAGAWLIDRPVLGPDNVEMCYWFAEYPQAPESFPYGVATFQSDLGYLSGLITEIVERINDGVSRAGTSAASAFSEIWPLTSDWHRCRFCNYRSLCGRGGVPGLVEDYMEDGYPDQLAPEETRLGFDLDWGQVQEIAY